MADLKKWLAQGANPDEELNNAIVADDLDRVRYLVSHGAHVDACGRRRPSRPWSMPRATDSSRVASFLVEHKANPNLSDPQRLDARSCMPRGATSPRWPTCC